MSSSTGGLASGFTDSARSIGRPIAGIVSIGGIADYAEGNGFDVAERAAGDVLRPLFGGRVPWEMSAGEIVDAVVPNFLPDFVPGAADSAMSVVITVL